MDHESASDQDVLTALDRVLEELRREFQSNPEFAHRVVRALGAEVRFGAEQAPKLLNPVTLVASKSPEEVRATLSGLSLSDLKKLAKSSNLASPIDVKGLSQEELVSLIQRRAELRLQSRQAN